MIANCIKSILFIFLSSLLITGCVARAESEMTQRIRFAMTEGNHRMLARQFTEKVSITIDNETFQYSKTQATYVMRSFFREHPPINFEYLHKGMMKNGRPYTLAIYRSPTHTYSLAIFLTSSNSGFLIKKLVFAKVHTP